MAPTPNAVDWCALERALRSALRRDVTLLVHPSSHVGGTRRLRSVESLVLEVSYARIARLSIRCDIDLSTASVHVRFIGAFLIESGSETLAQPACPPPRLDAPERGMITAHDALATCIQASLDAFRSAQVAAVASSPNERAKFEFELLKHVPGVDILVMTAPTSVTSARVVVSMILTADTTPQPLHFPEDVDEPCLEDRTDAPYIVFSIPLDDSDTSLKSWKASIHYPPQLELSGRVTEVTDIGTATSSVDVVSSWRENFFVQCNMRREFIRAIRKRAVVLELDPVDFSHVVILIQVAPTPTTPMILLVVRLQFTREFFLTRCLSDLQVSLIDGAPVHAPVTLHLEANKPNVDTSETVNDVHHFLTALLASVRKHYGFE